MTLVVNTPQSSNPRKQRSLKALLTTLLADVCSNSQYIHADCLGSFDVDGERYWLPRLIFQGDRSDEAALPINEGSVIDGFHAVNGVVRTCYDGVLSAPPGARPAPFEVILESPQLAPVALQRQALVLGVREIIREYRRLISFAANL